ncbi:MAG: hypothetical protein U0132_09860 [Gemmatimonadaceae bacterium]
MIDIEGAMIEQWRPDDERPAQLFDRLSWRVSPDAPEMTIDVPALFEKLPK